MQIYISQGSVATQLSCGGIFSYHFITNQNVMVKNFWKSVNTCRRYGQKTKVCGLLFWAPCILCKFA